jgi:peptidoglycan hydrolase-like protein with peptidoglycan-binding domain
MKNIYIKLTKFISNILYAIILTGCANYSNHEAEDYGKDVEYSDDGEFGETIEAKRKREIREASYSQKWETEEGQRFLILRNIQEDLALLGYIVGNTNGIIDEKTGIAIRQFQKKHGLSSNGEINEVLEERIHQEAWEIRREDITKRKLAMKREASDRQLAICKQQVDKFGKTKKHYAKLPKLINKARVFIYRNDGENQKYPESRLFVNNIKKGILSKNTFTVLYLEEGQYLLEEKIGSSNHIFGSVKSAPANISIQANKTYYV